MAITAINISDTKTISHPDDKVNPTIWTIGAVDSRIYGKLNDASLVVGVDPSNPDTDADVKLARNGLAFEVVQFGLKGFENFKDQKGDVAYATEDKVIGAKKYQVAKGDLLARVPGHVLQWLSAQIMDLNKLDDTEGKL